MKACKKPCKDCPWRRDSAKGWLGGQEPEIFTSFVQSGNLLPCHNTQDKDLSLEEINNSDTVEHCAGALITMKNNFMRSRNAEIAKLQDQFEQDPAFFKNLREFIDYHSKNTYTLEEFLETSEWDDYICDSDPENDHIAAKKYLYVVNKPKCKSCGEVCDSLDSYYETYHGGIMGGDGHCIHCCGK